MPAEASAYPPIGDYALIGDGKTAALVSRDGGVDWLCLPSFSSPSLFAALLDRRSGGHFTIRPPGPYTTTRRYLPDSNVVETEFRCPGGTLRLTDCLCLALEPDEILQPSHELLRCVECVSGEVACEVVFDPRPDYGSTAARLVQRGKLGWCMQRPGFAAFLRTEADLAASGPGTLQGRWRLRAGESRHLSFVFSHGDICALPPLGVHAAGRLRATVDWWRRWSGACRYRGKYREQVVRSVLTLKLLASHLTGAVVAAPTTSLPEAIGGTRNWDYRYCWLRDAALVLEALTDLGYEDEAEAFLAWLLHATRLTWPRLQVLYDIFGETRLRERTLPHLEGYCGSRPVRVGNAAHEQLQLDVYGEVIGTAYEFVKRGGRLDRVQERLLGGLGRSVCQLWRQPDQGIWEPRVAARHHTHSKLMCWVALDRLTRLGLHDDLKMAPSHLRAEGDAIRADIESKAFSPHLDSYVGYYGGTDPDASLLLMARYGFHPPQHPRLVGTCRYIRARLGDGALIYRYPPGADYDGVAGGENPFGPCCFWLVEYLARRGDRDEAARLFEDLLGCANDLGLYGEEIDAGTRAPRGNFPQAFTHVGLIGAALALEDNAEAAAP